MNCSEISEKLSAYIDKELTDEELHAVELHLNQCIECRQDMESLKATISLVSSLPRIPSPMNLTEAIHAVKAPQTKGEIVEEEAIEAVKPSLDNSGVSSSIKYLLWPALAAAVVLIAIGISLPWSGKKGIETALKFGSARQPSRKTDHAPLYRDTTMETKSATSDFLKQGEKLESVNSMTAPTKVARFQRESNLSPPTENNAVDLTLKLECKNINSDREKVIRILEDMKVVHRELTIGSQIKRQEKLEEKEKHIERESGLIVILSRAQRKRFYTQIKNLSSIRVVGGQDALSFAPSGAEMMAVIEGAVSANEPQKTKFSLPRADTRFSAPVSRRKEFSESKTRRFSRTASPPRQDGLRADMARVSRYKNQQPQRSVETERGVSAPSFTVEMKTTDTATIVAQSRERVLKMDKTRRLAKATSLSPAVANADALDNNDIKRVEIRFVHFKP